jgi:hypothetical protein
MPDPITNIEPVGRQIPPPPSKEVPGPEVLDFQPETFKVDHTNVATQVIPIEQQGEQGEFMGKYDLDYEVEVMNLPTQFIEFDEQGNAVPEDKQPERERTKLEEIHQNYLGDKAYQEMVQQASVNEKYLRSYDPNSLEVRMAQAGPKNEIEKGEYMQSYLLSQNLLGKTSAFLTGVVQSSMDPSRTATEYYQDIMEGHAVNLTKYHPNMVQTISLDLASLGLELPLFNAFGGAYSAVAGGSKGLQYAIDYANKTLVRGGMAPALAERYSLNTITAVNRMYQSGTVLGTHAGINDVAQQVADGATMETIDWDRATGVGNRSTAVGMGIGAVGFGGQFMKHSLARTKIADRAIMQKLSNVGIDAAAIGAEISVFTYGDTFLDSEKRVSDIGMQDWIHNTGIILGLRGMHARVGDKLPKKIGMFSPEEASAISKHVKLNPRVDPFQEIMKAEKGLESVMLDPSVPWGAKQKIAERGNMTLESGPISNVRYIETPDGRAQVRTFDAAGNLLEHRSFSDKATGLRAYEAADAHRIEVGDVMEISKMAPDARLEIAGKMRKKGMEKDFFDQELTDGLMKPSSFRTTEEAKAVNTFKESLSEYRMEQREAAQEAQKAAEGESKKVAEDKRGEITKAIEEMRSRTPYTDRDVMLTFERPDRLRASVEHPRFGIDKLLQDITQIRESGNYTDASIYGKGLDAMLGRPEGSDRIKIRSKSELNKLETELQNLRSDIQSELSRRKTDKEPSFETGNFELGRKAFETKQELFKELDRFPSLENLPEVMDYKTMQAIQEYRSIQSTRAKEFVPKEPTSFERTSENLKTMAERVRKAKGAADPEAGTLQLRIPGTEKVWDAAVEVTARSLETGARFVESIEKAVEYVKSTDFYKGLTRPQQVQVEQNLREQLGKYTDQQIAELTEAHGRAREYIKNIDRLKKEKPEEYWSVDRPTDKQIVDAAEQGRLIEVEGGSGIVAKDGEIIGLIKTDPTARGVAKAVLDKAVEMGGNKLNAFSGYLTDLYAKNGFTTVAKVPFDPKYAPKDAPKENLPEFVEYMVRDTGKKLPKDMLGKEFMNPTEAEAHWNRAAKMLEVPKEPVKRKPKTATQKKVDSQFQRERNKILVDEYAALKDQLLVEGKSAKEIQKNAKEVKETFNEFISGQAWQGTMDKRASKAIWRRINDMDFTKPGTIAEAKAYVEKAVNDTNFRAELAEFEAAYTKLDKFSNPKTYQTKNKSGVQVGKGVSVEVQDKIRQLRDRMIKEDPLKAQEEIMSILDRVEVENRNLTMEEFSRIEDLSFSGLLRGDHPGGLGYYKARVQDLRDIVKTGRTQDAARRMIRAEEHAQRREATFDILNLGTKKVELSPEKAANKQNFTAMEKVGKAFDWTFQDTWFTYLDKLSYHDKSSKPMRSYLNNEWGGMYIRAEEAHYVSKQAELKTIESKAQELFKTDGKGLKRVLKENANQINELKWERVDKDGKRVTESLDITMNQAYKRWMELQDPTLALSLTKQGYFDQMGNKTAKYDALEKMLTPEVKSWAEWQLNEFYPKYWESVNEVYREVYGTDMPIHGNYSPIFVADKVLTAEDAISHMIKDTDVRGMGGNNHLKLRTAHAKELLLLDGNDVLLNYVNKMEHFKAWARPLRDMNAVFGDRAVRESVRQNFGQNYLQTLDYYLGEFSGKPKHMDIWERSANKFRKNFTIGSLAFKPTVLVKQLTSFPAYMDNIPVKDFMSGLSDFAANYSTATKIMNEIPYIQERYSKGWDRDVELAMKKDIDSIIAKGDQASFVEVMMYLTKWGDRAAIQMGGWPVYKYHYNQGLKDGLPEIDARRVAEMEFVKATRSSQQATGPADLSQVQSGHWMFKFLTMYKTSPLQYHRKVMEGARGLIAGRGSKADNLKKMFIYHVLLPQVFQMAGNGFKWDGEDQATAAVLGNFNNVFAAGDGIQYIANQIRGLPFNYQATPVESLVTDAPRVGKDLEEIAWLMENPESVTFSEVMDAWKNMATIVSHATGTPVKGVHSTLSGIADVVDGNTEYPARRIIGWSEASLEDGVEIWDVFEGAEDEIRMKMNDKYTPIKEIKKQQKSRKSKRKKIPSPPSN